jgi:hypothetical protein
MGPPPMRRGVSLLLVTPPLLGMTQAGTHSLIDPFLHTSCFISLFFIVLAQTKQKTPRPLVLRVYSLLREHLYRAAA